MAEYRFIEKFRSLGLYHDFKFKPLLEEPKEEKVAVVVHAILKPAVVPQLVGAERVAPPRRRIVARRRRVADSLFLRICSSLTGFLLFFFASGVVIREQFGDAMICSPGDLEMVKTLNSYCWTHPTYTYQPIYAKASPEKDPWNAGHPVGYVQIEHGYFSWFALMLFLQSILFFLPGYLLQILNGGCLEELLQRNRFRRKTQVFDQGEILAGIIFAKWKKNSSFGFKFILCEALCTLILILHLSSMNYLLNGHFIPAVIPFLFYYDIRNNSTQVIPKVFPPEVYCDISGSGLSTSPEHAVLCSVPVNEFLHGVFTCIYMWYIILAFVSMFNILLWCAVICVPGFRILLFDRFDIMFFSAEFRAILQDGNIGNCIVLANLRKYMPRDEFIKVFRALGIMIYESRHSTVGVQSMQRV